MLTESRDGPALLPGSELSLYLQAFFQGTWGHGLEGRASYGFGTRNVALIMALPLAA